MRTNLSKSIPARRMLFRLALQAKDRARIEFVR
jgi:hypothetical protein